LQNVQNEDGERKESIVVNIVEDSPVKENIPIKSHNNNIDTTETTETT